jgi:hypothetical protein
MAGHTDYTTWINNKAKYIIVLNAKESIESTFFTSNSIPNSDTFNIKTNKGIYTFNNKNVDWNELKNRYGRNR